MMMHLVNGQSTLFSLQNAGLEGEFFSMDEILMEGPAPNGLRDREDWIFRAAELERLLQIPASDYLAGVEVRLMQLEKARQAAEVILWYEEDLFCQINFMYLLEWFRRHPLADGRLSIICPEEKRLGELQAADLAALFPERKRASDALLNTAHEAWTAHTNPEPLLVQKLAREAIPAWPLLQHGLKSHLERFPSARNGLNRVETEILNLLSGGPLNFGELFGRFSRSSHAAHYGLGDLQVMRSALDLSGGKNAALALHGCNLRSLSPDGQQEMRDARLEITTLGEELLEGKRDWLELTPTDRWLGGVHLQGHKAWRWDAERWVMVNG